MTINRFDKAPSVILISARVLKLSKRSAYVAFAKIEQIRTNTRVANLLESAPASKRIHSLAVFSGVRQITPKLHRSSVSEMTSSHLVPFSISRDIHGLLLWMTSGSQPYNARATDSLRSPDQLTKISICSIMRDSRRRGSG